MRNRADATSGIPEAASTPSAGGAAMLSDAPNLQMRPYPRANIILRIDVRGGELDMRPRSQHRRNLERGVRVSQYEQDRNSWK